MLYQRAPSLLLAQKIVHIGCKVPKLLGPEIVLFLANFAIFQKFKIFKVLWTSSHSVCGTENFGAMVSKQVQLGRKISSRSGEKNFKNPELRTFLFLELCVPGTSDRKTETGFGISAQSFIGNMCPTKNVCQLVGAI